MWESPLTERDALLRSILDNPWCDTARLVFADYLDENGEGARAEFIRLQIALRDRPFWGLCGPGSNHAPWCASSDDNRNACNAHGHEGDRMRNRVQSLFTSNWMQWGLEVSGPWTPHGHIHTTVFLSAHDNSACAHADLSRGFVSSIELPTAAFLEHAEAIFRAHPVISIRLSDKRPAPIRGGKYIWFGPGQESQDRLPSILWYALDHVEFGSEASAYSALDAVCVAFGREKADLPELEPVKVGA